MPPSSEKQMQERSLSAGSAKMLNEKLGQSSVPGSSSQSSKAKKFDQGKTRFSLFPIQVWIGVCQVMTFGAAKYGDENWKAGDMKVTRLLDAAFRHITAFLLREDKDPESGLHHLFHAIANLGMAWFITMFGCGVDDRAN